MERRSAPDPIGDVQEPLAIERLTKREREVLGYLGKGMSRAEIAKCLFRSPKTIDNHCTRIYHKLGVRSQAQLVNRMHQTPTLPESATIAALVDESSPAPASEALRRSLDSIEVWLQSEPNAKFFHGFLLALSSELGVDFAGICEADHEGSRFVAVAVVADGQAVSQMVSPFAGCPCTDAMRLGHVACSRNARQEYPKDDVFQECGIESYIGVCLEHRLVGQLGTLWVASRTPIENESEVLALLMATRRRIATELALLAAIDRLDSLDQPTDLPSI